MMPGAKPLPDIAENGAITTEPEVKSGSLPQDRNIFAC